MKDGGFPNSFGRDSIMMNCDLFAKARVRDDSDFIALRHYESSRVSEQLPETS